MQPDTSEATKATMLVISSSLMKHWSSEVGHFLDVVGPHLFWCQACVGVCVNISDMSLVDGGVLIVWVPC